MAAAAAGRAGRRRRVGRHGAAAACLGGLLLLLPPWSAAAGAGRTALIVANGAYASLPRLPNPVADARLLAGVLERHGFEVQLALDTDLAGLREALARFAEAARGDEVALVYYSGHGVQVDGVNYVFPVTSAVHTRGDLGTSALPLPEMLDAVAVGGPAVGILVLDACRNNPLPALGAEAVASRSLAPREGLARMAPQQGMVIAYATAPGQVALDGVPGRNSPFASAFASALDEPGLEIGLLFRKVSDRVREATAGTQVPWTEAALTGAPLYLNEAGGGSGAGPGQDDLVGDLNAALALDEPGARRLALTRFAASAPASSPLRVAAERYLALDTEAAAVARREETTAGGGLEGGVEDWQRVLAVQGTTAEGVALDAFLAEHGGEDPLAERAKSRRDTLGAAGAATPAPPDTARLLWPLVGRAGDPEQLRRFADLVSGTPEAAAALARAELATLQAEGPPASTAQSPTATPAAEAPVVVAVTLGTGPAAIGIPGLPAAVTLTRPPRRGRVLVEGGRQLSPEVGTEALPTLAPALAYEPRPDSRELVDDLAVRLGDPTAGAREVEVQVNVTVDPCDQQAGARFDPQGVVLGRYPNEVDAATAVPACREAVARFPGVARFGYELGRALETAGEFSGAKGLYEVAARGGHHLALTGLGVLHENGRGVAADPTKAVAYYRRAAEAGEPLAMNSLGRAYRDGRGVGKDRAAAIAWFRKAAARGHTFAYNNLGALLNDAGRHQEALELFRTSAEAGDSYGFNNMGLIHERGLGVPRDLRQAVGWYEKAAAAGQPNASVNLGLLYRDGRGESLPPDPQRAAFWFADAARRGQAWGHVHLAALHAAGALGETPDPVLAARLLARAAATDRGGEAGRTARGRFAELPKAAGITAVQQTLAERGLDPGPADGSMGSKTRQAVARFAQGYEPPLRPDAPLVDLLGALLASAEA